MKQVVVRKGAYRDSVTLMQATQELTGRTDVTSALVAMATELNLDLLSELGFDRPGDMAASDLLIAIETDGTPVDDVLAAVDAILDRQSKTTITAPAAGPPARTVTAAARRGTAALALVSTPGRVAAIDAADALASGLDVMIFSDNMSVAEEVRLKELAARDDLLVMGPDCGTAVVNGVGLGFANVVRPGPVALVAASGTGAQQVLALLDGCGVGVTHCLGLGGRDLSDAVAGRSALTALSRLDADEAVELIVLISKTPGQVAAGRVDAHIEQLSTPVVVGYLGPGKPNLTSTSERAVAALGASWAEPARWGGAPANSNGYLRGLFVGGTLCDEAALIARAAGRDVFSNISKNPAHRLGTDLAATGHTFIDFGDDQLTSGRPHPMIDPSLRLRRLEHELADDTCGAVLLDVVLGHGAHPDPAAELVPVITSATKPVVVTVVGTRDDPQGTGDTCARLASAGAVIHASNAAATREALTLVNAS
jgi:FdrA protein